MNYGSLLQVYKDQNLFICSNCEVGCRYLGVPFPNYCSRCGKTYDIKVHPLEVGVMCYEEMPELKQCPVSSALKKHKV